MQLTMDEVSIRCMGCFEKLNLEQAVRNGWKMCKHCNFTICSLCLNDLEEPKKCLSHVCSSKKRLLLVEPLPVEKIIIFAQNNYQSDYHQGILYKLFYKDKEKLYAPPFFSVQEKESELEEIEQPSQVQQEIWKNFQLVITKRKRGKFITWERVI